MNFTRTEIATACHKYGNEVGPLPAGVNGAQLLWSLCGVESSFGYDCTPRHEAAFDKGGPYASHAPVPILLSRYGHAGACSYGPMQLMLCNAPLIHGPASFDNIDLAFQDSIDHLNKGLRWFKPANLSEIAAIWNAGHICDDQPYEDKVIAAYRTPMPA